MSNSREKADVPSTHRLSTNRRGTVTELSPSIHQFQAVAWQCNCITVLKGREALVIDACWSRPDMDHVCEHVRDRDTYLLITHGDVDHACSIGTLPDAVVVAGPETKARIDDGSAGRELATEARKWGLEVPSNLRVDKVVAAGTEVELGGFRLETIEGRGHAVDGLGYVLLNEGVFAVGDYLMASMSPLVWWSFRTARETTERLLESLDTYDLRWVVPGHGPALTVAETRKVGVEDLAYMEAVERVADDAKRERWAPREWLLGVQSVPIPRPDPTDIEMLCPKLVNAAATFRDRDLEPDLPWILNMA